MTVEKMRWAPKIRRIWIWQLHQNDAAGAADEELLLKTGQALLERAQSVLMATLEQMNRWRCSQTFTNLD